MRLYIFLYFCYITESIKEKNWYIKIRIFQVFFFSSFFFNSDRDIFAVTFIRTAVNVKFVVIVSAVVSVPDPHLSKLIQAHDVKTTLYWRCYDVKTLKITLKKRCCDVVCRLGTHLFIRQAFKEQDHQSLSI